MKPDSPVRPKGPPVIPDFELIRQIGQGAYGEVWLARGLTGVYRAIKIIWRDQFADAGPFEREFNGLKKFSSMSLPEAGQLALLHVGQNEQAGFFYYVMELADDVETGREVNPSTYAPLTLREVRTRRGRLPTAECVTFGVELARALAGLHARGLVHRDIKPSNVILVGGVPKLADIGLVASTADALSYVGTEGFVPPEGPGQPSADVFALGRLLYELATGLDRQEFPRLPPELDQLSDRKVPLALNKIILRACEPVPEQRYHDASAMLDDLLGLQAGGTLRRKRTRAWVRRVGTALAVVAVAAAGAGLWWRLTSPAAASGKSIAVLPFANIGNEKENEYFTDGIHEDILTNLAHIAELRVISRTSVNGYRSTPKSSRQIAQELGVEWLLEGSVQRAGDKVHVTGQLISARTDKHVWAQSYDRDLGDVFSIQSELAQAIAAALKAKISPQEKNALERKPTDNPAAYDDYLKARSILTGEHGWGETGLKAGLYLLRKAVELDPRFAEAWAMLGSFCARACFEEIDRSAENLETARIAIEKAVQLAPDNPTVIGLVGDYYYYASRDYARATEYYLRLAKRQPNNPDVFTSLGDIQRHEGRWADALSNFRRAFELDPKRAGGFLVQTLLDVRRFDEAEALARRQVKSSPNGIWPRFELAIAAYYARGSVAEMNEFSRMEFKPPLASVAISMRKMLAWTRGDFAEAVRLDRLQPFDDNWVNRWVQDVAAAIALANIGDMPGARARAEATIPVMLAELQRQPDSSFLHDMLAQAYALLGDKPQALLHAQRAMETVPESRDAAFGVDNAVAAAAVLAWVGEKDKALAEFARLLRTPHGVNVREARNGISSGWAIEWAVHVSWKPLMDDPRFQALLADPKNNAPLF